MASPRVPNGLGTAGARLWRDLHEGQEFSPAESVTVEEMCRIKDRLDKLNAVLVGESDSFIRFREREDEAEIVLMVDSALSESRQQANIFKQLYASLRIPDAAGVKPQARGARGSYAPSARRSGSVSSLDRARAAKAGS